jgi:hypothetical protein
VILIILGVLKAKNQFGETADKINTPSNSSAKNVIPITVVIIAIPLVWR